MAARRIPIAARFCGPPDSGNGGYAAGLLAQYIDGVAEVTLRRPPPLGMEMEIGPGDDGAYLLIRGDELIAEARPGDIDIAVPDLPDFAAAQKAAKAYTGFQAHIFPTCFVCGPDRREGDGLRIFPGKLDGGGVVAAPWVPDESLAPVDGRVAPEFLWAALDCPGAFAVIDRLDSPLLLGRMTARLDAPVEAGERYVVAGWEISRDGRKLYSGTAVLSAAGTLCGIAKSVWIMPA